MFVGRENELDFFQRIYDKGGFAYLVVYGDPGVGKTAFVREFTKDKTTVYFTGRDVSEAEHVSTLVEAVNQVLGKEVWPTCEHPWRRGGFLFQYALEDLFAYSTEHRFVLVIDDYPKIVESVMGASSILQRLIDEYKDSSQMMLLLCGGPEEYMREKVMAYRAPLYGRQNGQFRVLPLDFYSK